MGRVGRAEPSRMGIAPMARALREMSSAASRQKTLLLVWHSRTGLAEQMSNALERGAYECARQMECGERIVVQRRRASEATAEEVLSASGYLFCAPENLASTSGEVRSRMCSASCACWMRALTIDCPLCRCWNSSTGATITCSMHKKGTAGQRPILSHPS